MYPTTSENSKLLIGGIQAEKLVEEFGSPLYVYDAAIIKERFESLVSCIDYPEKRIHFAMKCNSNPAVLKILLKEGCGIDAVSLNEVKLALKVGFSADKILFTGVNLSEEEVNEALDLGVLLNVGSLHALERFGKNHGGEKLSIRVNPAFGDGHHSHVNTGGPESKFGIYESDFEPAKEIIQKYNLNLVGVQCHIGSGILNVESYRKLMNIILPMAEQFDGIEFVDFGGGIGVAYRPGENDFDLESFGKMAGELMSDFSRRHKNDVAFAIEPGRFLVAESGYFLMTVRDIKSTPKFKFAGVDSGFNHLRRPMTYGSYHHILNASNTDGRQEEIVVAGYICESGDVFTRNEEGPIARLISEVKEGDVLAALTAGAYGFSMASNYNTQVRPAEVLVENGKARLIRRRENLDDLLQTAIFE